MKIHLGRLLGAPLALLALLPWVCLQGQGRALGMDEPATRKVLILNSYHPGMSFSDDEARGIRSTLPGTTEVFMEYMDAKRISSPEYLDLLARAYALKYAGRRFDLVFSLDDDAFQFLLRHRGALFPETPVVFCGVNHFADEMLESQPWFTGVLEAIDMKETLDLALALRPGARQILVITDNTTSGLANRSALELLSRSGRYAVSFVFLDSGGGLLLPELLRKLKESPPDSIVYHSDFFQDRSGNALNIETVMPLVSASAPGPVFAHGAIYLGRGIVGGKLNSGFYQGQAAGELARRIWRGESPGTIPVVRENVNRYMFDWKELKRWGISLSALPAGADIVNRESSFYERYRLYLWVIAGFVMAEAVIIVLLGVNVLRRRRAEGALRVYERIVSTSQDLMALVSRDYVYQAVNASLLAAHARSRDQVVGMKLAQVLGEADFGQKVQPRLDRALSGEPVHYQEVFDFPGSGRRIMDVSYFPLFDDKGSVEGVVVNSRDITETRKLEEQLMQSQKIESIGTLASGVAHEINNPINGVMNYAQLILDREGAESPSGELACEIVLETERVALIVRNLLTFARNEKQSLSQTALSDIVTSVLSLIQTVVRRDQIELEVSIPENLPGVRTRAQQIQQVLMNLVTNARDALNERYPGHSPEKRLRISARMIEKDGRPFIRTTVEDWGSGVPGGIRDRIFDPFFTTKPKESGTGLGLSISYGIVRDHGGDLTVESEPGRSTRFHMDLPLDHQGALPGERGEAERG
ncbi:MAG: ATP-binding protein [Syntrophobacteraceae bacterium]|jgi:PAS domain S-box-containing protein|nr:ATP-binding protein [Syntrophobacteraceae bacterium]